MCYINKSVEWTFQEKEQAANPKTELNFSTVVLKCLLAVAFPPPNDWGIHVDVNTGNHIKDVEQF